MASPSSEDFSVVVLASDLGIDGRQFQSEEDDWHDCPSSLPSAGDHSLDYAELDSLNFFRLEGGSDMSGNRIFRVVGKYFPAPVVTADRLKQYVFHKILTEMPEGPFCIVYMHSTVQKDDNSPGATILRWIYEELPDEHKERLQVVYFIHPGLWSRLVFATFGRLLLSGGLYWKIKYISRLQYLWHDIKKGEVEIPEFVHQHDDILEHRPLTDYGIEPDPMHFAEVPTTAYSFGKYDSGWPSREHRF